MSARHTAVALGDAIRGRATVSGRRRAVVTFGDTITGASRSAIAAGVQPTGSTTRSRRAP